MGKLKTFHVRRQAVTVELLAGQDDDGALCFVFQFVVHLYNGRKCLDFQLGRPLATFTCTAVIMEATSFLTLDWKHNTVHTLNVGNQLSTVMQISVVYVWP